jgi:hypothetical protein
MSNKFSGDFAGNFNIKLDTTLQHPCTDTGAVTDNFNKDYNLFQQYC